MTQIDNRFKVKKGLEVTGDANFLNNLNVSGDITINTQPATDVSNKAATTAFVKQAVNNLIGAAPGALDTLKELADALGDDPSFATTVNANIALKAPIDSPTFTGTPSAPTILSTDNSTKIATTAFVQAQKASPAFTGIPTAPTAAVDTSTTQLATTAFVLNQAGSATPLMNGVASVGVSNRYSRQDHVHASDTTKANLSGASFTGAVNFAADVTMSGATVFHNSTDNIAFKTDAAGKDIVFSSSVGEIVRFKSGGNALIGTAVDNGVDKLQVNGSVTATVFKGGAALTGTPTAPNAAAGTNNTQIANTAYVDTGLALKSNIANPTFTGIPKAPTASPNNNTTQIATTAYVDAADNLKAPLDSAALTGIPTAPTAGAGTNTSQIATTSFVSTAISNLIGGAPGALDTLKELADAINDDSSFTTTITNNLAAKAPLASPVFTGSPTAPTPVLYDNSGHIATTGYVQGAMNAVLTKSVAGGSNVNLTANEAVNRVIIFTGALTANISVIFPTANGGWTIINNTSGAYTLTVKMATGAAVVVAQSYSNDIVSTGTDMVVTQTDYTNAYLAGNPTTTTQASTDSSTRIATTAFVKAQSYFSAGSTIDGGSF